MSSIEPSYDHADEGAGERDGDLEGVLRPMAALALPRGVALARPRPRPRRSSPATCRRSGEADRAGGGRRVARRARARRCRPTHTTTTISCQSYHIPTTRERKN